MSARTQAVPAAGVRQDAGSRRNEAGVARDVGLLAADDTEALSVGSAAVSGIADRTACARGSITDVEPHCAVCGEVMH